MNQRTLKHWLIAIRPWSLPASSMPALAVISYIFYLQKNGSLQVNWIYGLLAFSGAVIFQAASNLIGDYFDFKHGVDRKDSFGSSRLLVEKIFTPREILCYGFILLTIGSLVGLFLAFQSGTPLLWIGTIGVLSTIFYYKLKYMALGDIIIFIIYGQLIALGTFFVMTGNIDLKILALAAPIGLLVVNIVHANNTRDIFHDKRAGIKTLAMLIGLNGAKIQYAFLALMAYILIAIMIVMNILPPICLLVFLSLPLTVKNIRKMNSAQPDSPQIIMDLDGDSAKAVMFFSVLFSISIFSAALI